MNYNIVEILDKEKTEAELKKLITKKLFQIIELEERKLEIEK